MRGDLTLVLRKRCNMTRLCTHAESSADVPGRQSEGRAAVTDGSEQESDAIALAHLQFAASYCFSAHRVSRTTAVRSIWMMYLDEVKGTAPGCEQNRLHTQSRLMGPVNGCMHPAALPAAEHCRCTADCLYAQCGKQTCPTGLFADITVSYLATWTDIHCQRRRGANAVYMWS